MAEPRAARLVELLEFMDRTATERGWAEEDRTLFRELALLAEEDILGDFEWSVSDEEEGAVLAAVADALNVSPAPEGWAELVKVAYALAGNAMSAAQRAEDVSLGAWVEETVQDVADVPGDVAEGIDKAKGGIAAAAALVLALIFGAS